MNYIKAMLLFVFLVFIFCKKNIVELYVTRPFDIVGHDSLFIHKHVEVDTLKNDILQYLEKNIKKKNQIVLKNYTFENAYELKIKNSSTIVFLLVDKNVIKVNRKYYSNKGLWSLLDIYKDRILKSDLILLDSK